MVSVRDFRSGFLNTMPLWPGVIPFALVFAALARQAGLTAWETQALSLLVFAGSAQFTAAGLVSAGGGTAGLVLATALINLRHLLYGFSLKRHVSPSGFRKALAAFLLTDETYGVSLKAFEEGRGSLAFVIGSGVSLYLVWNGATALGLFASVLVDPADSGLELVFPLIFAAFTAPYLRQAKTRTVALAAFAGGLSLIPLLPTGLGLMTAMILGLLFGVVRRA